jgi:hypothetical protein
LALLDEKIQKCIKKINELDRSKHNQWTKLFNNKISDYFTTTTNNQQHHHSHHHHHQQQQQQQQQINTELLTQENSKIDKEIAKLKSKLKVYEKKREEIIKIDNKLDVDGLSIIYNQQDNSINTTSSTNTSATTTTSNKITNATNNSDNKSIDNLSLPLLGRY